MREIIAALQTSVDGLIEGPNGELDRAMAEDEETWRDLMKRSAQQIPLSWGGGMYLIYEQYWLALLANPIWTKNEIAHVRRADKIPNIVLSKILDKMAWKTTRSFVTWKKPKKINNSQARTC